MSEITKVSRRDFLRLGATGAAGLVLAFELPAAARGVAPAAATRFQPSVWLQIAPDDQVTIWVSRSEMGQGVQTALPAIVADELGADWKRVAVRQGDYDPRFGEQMTVGSMSVRTQWEPLRKAGATAREMLIGAAAARWGVDRAACRAHDGAVHHEPTKRRLTFGALAAAAAKLAVPATAPLKDPADFRLVGRSLPRVDTKAKIEGTAIYGIDVRRKGQLFASVLRCPVFGGKVASFDPTKAKAVRGVRHVLQIPSGVAVVADTTWAAMQGRAALTVQWDEGPGAKESSATLRRQFDELLKKPAKAHRNDGNVAAALGGAPRRVEAVYELPFLAHTPMEPANATAEVANGRCEVWVPTQSPAHAHEAAVKASGLPASAVTVHVTFLGGGFGGRSPAEAVEESVTLSRQLGKPVQVLFTREDDLQHDHYRPASLHRLTAGLAANGTPLAWHHRYAATPIMSSLVPQTPRPEMMELGGAVDVPYLVPAVRVEFAPARSSVPRGFLRSVAHTYTTFVVESFIDELAAAAKQDPYGYRRRLLRERRIVPYPGRGNPCDTARLLGVLELCATKARWGTPLPAGVGRGIAVAYSFCSYAAEVVEASVAANGAVRVHRVVCAVDCGRVVNPDIVVAQVEGGVALGLTMALKDPITIEKGRVVQSNFDGYDILRLDEMPTVEVHLVPSTVAPTGIGEPAVPPTAPAVANAVFAATGKRLRRLPIRPADLAR